MEAEESQRDSTLIDRFILGLPPGGRGGLSVSGARLAGAALAATAGVIRFIFRFTLVALFRLVFAIIVFWPKAPAERPYRTTRGRGQEPQDPLRPVASGRARC